MSKFRIIDLHSHPSMKPFNNEGYRAPVDIWEATAADAENYYKLKKRIREVITETARDSQAHLREWIKGHVASSICALHPTERGWFIRNTRKEGWFRKAILKLLLKTDEDLAILGAALTGFPKEKVRKIIDMKNDGLNYFEEPTWKEYLYLKNNQSAPGPWGFSYTIVNDYTEYINTINAGNQLAVILSIEGGHALTNIQKSTWFNTSYNDLTEDDKQSFKSTLVNNIKAMKGAANSPYRFEHTPFFITMVHMYNNLLAGHAKSYSSSGGSLPGMDDLLDQTVGMNDGITEAGCLFINELLSRDNGRRVLIDVKHLSMKARTEYYKYVQEKRAKGDHIPIIASHAAVNGFKNNDPGRHDTFNLDCDSYLSRWSINLSDEDIKAIHDSDGIIGLVVHEGRTPGGKTKKRLNRLKKCIAKGGKNAFEGQQALTELYCQLILSNIFQIVNAIGDASAWQRIAIGSDYDGIMDPFNCYPKVGNFHELIADIGKFLNDPKPLPIYIDSELTTISREQVSQMMYNFTAEDIMQMIAHTNAELFLSKYFTKDYLEGILA